MPPKRQDKAARVPAPYRVFVSHATADKWIARVMCEKIDAIPGARTFRDDRDIGGGDTIPKVLREELQGADEMLVLLTAFSITRQWVLLEIGAAWGMSKRIVPVCYNATVDQVPIVSAERAYPLNDFDDYLSDLRGRVRKERT